MSRHLGHASQGEVSAAEVFVALGSNQGDPYRYLVEATHQIHALQDTSVTRCSPVYANAAVSETPQADFLNAVIKVHTTLMPEQFLKALLNIEQELGRIRPYANAPRTIDLDILSYEQIICTTEQLTLPHPRIADRRFVLQPWIDIAPFYRLPGGETLQSLLAKAPPHPLKKVAQLAMPKLNELLNED